MKTIFTEKKDYCNIQVVIQINSYCTHNAVVTNKEGVGMNEGLKKFEELLKTDTAFQEKLKAAMASYSGEQTDQAVFEAILVPLAKEYGIYASFEEYKEYVDSISNEDRELSIDEANQVAGGGKGLGATACLYVGVGLGGSINSDLTACLGLGAGWGADACAGNGASAALDD